MTVFNLRRFVLALASAVFGAATPAVALQRQANTSLNFPAAPPSSFGYSLERVFTGLTFHYPLAMKSPPGDTRRLFVLERTGRIHLIRDVTQPTQTVFLDLSDRVFLGNEGGLLGLAFHPKFAENGFFFVYYTVNSAPAGQPVAFENRLARFRVRPENPDLVDPESEFLLIRQVDPTDYHNSGDLEFGPDGYLYCSLGEGSEYQSTFAIDSGMFGGIIRIDVDELPENLPPNEYDGLLQGYRVPADNPFAGATTYMGRPVNPNRVRSEFWALGLRNAYRFAFDPVDGRLFAGDVGWINREEINLIQRGAHFGWKAYEGSLPILPSLLPPGQPLAWPLYEYGGDGFRGTVIADLVYRGTQFPDLDGAVIFGDWNRGWIRALHIRPDGAVEVTALIEGGPRPMAFGLNPATGDVLMAQWGWQGYIYRLVRRTDEGVPSLLSQTGAFRNLETLEPEAGIVPYEVNAPFWSDHALKRRWFSVPRLTDKIVWQATAPWQFPNGSVWIKHFEMEMQPGQPTSRRRLETRFLVKGASQFYGLTYRWLPDQSDAVLATALGEDEELLVGNPGAPTVQRWRYPSRTECMLCHNSSAQGVLGFNTEQLNGLILGEGQMVNQLERLANAGYFTRPLPDPQRLPRLYRADDPMVSVEVRARSYLAANCSYCHRGFGRGHGRGWLDAQFAPTLPATSLLWGQLTDDMGSAANRIMVPGDLVRSVLYTRIGDLGRYHMPPIATSVVNESGVALLEQWIMDTAFVVGRHIFYNNSRFDGFTPGPSPADDAAIAPDKTALLPDGTATFPHYTSYNRGLNGVMVDIVGLRHPLSAEDFEFTVGNTADPNLWLPAPAPASVTTRTGAGVYGASRITLIWPDEAIKGVWLKVKVKATAATGLGYPDEFYFGNAPGETGNESTNARVDTADLLRVRANPRSLLNPAPIDSPYDINRDGRVDTADQLIVRGNATSALTALRLLQFPYDGWMATRLESESLP